MKGGIELEGLKDVEHLLGDFLPREIQNLDRAATHYVASRVAKFARSNAPRDKGTLRRAIKAKRRRPRNPARPYSDVMVEHGKGAKNDAFYWRFIEFGTVDEPARPFFNTAIRAIKPEINKIYREKVFDTLAKRARRKNKVRARL